jgi:hypothetical protein
MGEGVAGGWERVWQIEERGVEDRCALPGTGTGIYLPVPVL